MIHPAPLDEWFLLMADETKVRNKYSDFPVPLAFVIQMRFVELMARK